MAHPLLENKPGSKELLLGNEAIVRGALEAGIQFVTCYPGTPSSEVPDTFYKLYREAGLYFEYSVNEKVAVEVGAGASLSGALTMVTMKHVGVNVAADPLMTFSYLGAPGGFLLLSADDPHSHSSQNEQDNRYFCRLGQLPCFEPSTAQEAKDMTRDALRLSRKWEQPVMLRTTTRVNHLRGVVEFGPMEKPDNSKVFVKNPQKYVTVPTNARVRHSRLLARMAKIAEESDKSPWNKVWGDGKLGVIASGISRAYLHDVLSIDDLTSKVKVLELGFSYPLPEKKILELMGSVDALLVLEELEPVVETEVRDIAYRHGLTLPIYGKGDELSRMGEYSTTIVRAALVKALTGEAPAPPATCPGEEGLPMRAPNLCPGCSHRSVYYAVRKVFGDDAVYSTDIGCYTLGILPPLSCADFLICMGSSVTGGSGMAKASGKPVVAFIGDSTFFHSGITGLINAVFNRHNLLIVVLDNQATAMTGHQPHPGVPECVLDGEHCRVDIESIVRGCGVSQLRKVQSYNQNAVTEALEELKQLSGVRVLIAEEPCVIFARKSLKNTMPMVAYVAQQSAEVVRCLETLACPAFYRQGEDVFIDEEQCSGCMVCLQITKDIKAKKRSA